jgi:hypothetical protein
VTLSKSCCLAVFAAWAASGQAQQPASAAVELQRAAYLQRTVGDLDTAIQIYRQVIASRPADRAIVAQAESGLAQALQQKATNPAGQDSRPRPAVVEGKVVNQTTGTPLKKTMLTLSPNSMGGGGRPATTESDEEGRFSFPRVEPGTYMLRGERAGYASQAYGARDANVFGAPIPLAEGEELKNIVFKLVPNALLSGKVLDEDGDPVSRASVMVLRYTYRTSGRLLQPFANGTTGANGEYSVSVPPGRYYLVTSPPNMNNPLVAMNGVAVSQTSPPAKVAEDAPEYAYGPMFYPNSPDELGAAPINAAGGADLRSLDIRLAKAKTYRVRGRIADLPANTVLITLVPKTVSAVSNLILRTASIQPDRSFEFAGVLPGAYNLLGNGPGGVSIYHSPVIVTDRHISGLPVVLSAVGELKGTLTIEGDDAPSAQSLMGFDHSRVMVGFDSFENGSNPMVSVGDDGKFSIRGPIFPDRYHPWIGHLPQNCWVKAVRYDGRDVKDEGIDFRDGITGPVEVVLSRTAGDISGVVVDEDGKPVAGATAVLLSKSGTYLTRYSANTDYQGKFQFYPVRPGDYTALAWDDAAYLSWYDPEFLKPFMSRGVELKVTENDKKALSLKMIPVKETQR